MSESLPIGARAAITTTSDTIVPREVRIVTRRSARLHHDKVGHLDVFDDLNAFKLARLRALLPLRQIVPAQRERGGRQGGGGLWE